MSCAEESTSAAPLDSTSTPGINNTSKSLIQDALEANKHLQRILIQRAEQLEAKLNYADRLLAAATVEESQDEPESEIVIPGAKRATGLFPSSEFLNPASPFYEEATKRSKYINNISPHTLKPKDIEVLSAAVRQENERLRALTISQTDDNSLPRGTIDLQNNVEGLDWRKIAEKVSDASSVKRSAIDCRIVWVSDKHPSVNHTAWSEDEMNALNGLISQYTKDKKAVDWVEISEKLGTNRTPIDCMKHGVPRHRHNWSPEADQKLLVAVESCGHDNWQLVARKVSEHVSAGQCQNRWQKTLNPMLRKGAWTEEEDERLRKSVAGYGSSWIQVATAIPGRTNDQCRERWMEHINIASAKTIWTLEEDKMLLDLVKDHGNQWKIISLQIGNNKTGQNCRLRFEKLKRLAKNASSSLNPDPSYSIGRDGSTPQDTPMMSPSASMHEFPSHPDVEPVLPIITPRPKPRAKRKGKAKENSAAAGNQQTAGAAQPQLDVGMAELDSMDTVEDGTTRSDQVHDISAVESGSAPSKDSRKPILQPRPKPRPKGPAKGKVSEALLPSENHIDGSGLAAPEETGQAETIPDPRLNPAPKPGKRAKRRVNDISDILEAPKSKRAKAARIADSTLSLAPTELVAPASPTADSRNRESSKTDPKQRGRSQKANPSTPTAESKPEHIVQQSSAMPTTDMDAPMMRTRRQSSRLLTAQRRSS
ncbi:hypothetical protein HYPSUDRAFT_473559 [Hypholoma sublateritium FD-334 SS-4]|uniref:Uncharacterized protein n=1 Tax=Hypholoma sublateritium (strain FD-334 SS-4) TaxID=945553 RepID=A0A0D2ML47_HYPSF|nr:hypothetical protein HYPSUDRAFT_473559 [Hypholoma sublateritium FD-334 SS-4]